MAEQQAPSGPDLREDGYTAADLLEGDMVAGRVGDAAVVLVRTGGEVFAIGGTCTHYGGPLGDGLFDGDLVRCPWHHACFDVRTGRAARAPALAPVSRHPVTERDGKLYVGEAEDASWERAPLAEPPESVVVIGGGAAAAAAVGELRSEGYEGPITAISAEPTVPVDRPNLSKDYLAGDAPEEWIPLRDRQTYADWGIDLRTGVTATAIDLREQTVALSDGTTLPYGALLLAPGAEPVRLDLPGADAGHVHYLRTLGDSRAIIAATESATRAVVVGASFIGLEVAASLRNRDMEVDVVDPVEVPMARVLGDDVGRFVRSLHEAKGVRFHMNRSVAAVRPHEVELDDGTTLAADLVVVGVGVRPRTELAREAGLTVEDGIVVDEFLGTSDPNVWAAGDAASYPDPRLGRRIRVEHWVVAERQGQTAARNMLGRDDAYTHPPFFWSQHYDVPVNYVGHADDWDEAVVSGSLDGRDALVAYRQDGRIAAVATVYRDNASLAAEVALERNDQPALERLVGGGD